MTTRKKNLEGKEGKKYVRKNKIEIKWENAKISKTTKRRKKEKNNAKETWIRENNWYLKKKIEWKKKELKDEK